MRIVLLSDEGEEIESHKITIDLKNREEMVSQSMEVACIINEAIAAGYFAKKENITFEQALIKVKGQVTDIAKKMDRFNFKERN